MVNNNSHQKCFQCGSDLILIKKETVKLEGTRYPQTNTVYRCSNEDCQKKKDKEHAERQKIREHRESTEKERMEKIQEKRRLGKQVKTEEN